MRNLGIILVILVMILLGWKFHKDWCECCCDKDTTTEVVPVGENTIVRDSGPLLYNWSNHHPIYGDGWAGYRDSIAAGIGDNRKLQITGYYRTEEDNNTSFSSLGIARADSLRRAFGLAEDRALLRDRTVDERAGDREHPFISASFRPIITTEKIKEIDDKTLIYFPYASTNKLNDTEVEAYLDDVAERVNSSGERVQLIGHTDNSGSAEGNQKLGQARADVVKNYLLTKGVPSSKIISTSKGETNPIANNDSNQGRAQNRRTELKIIK